MFRRPGKNPLEEESIYRDEQAHASPYKYGPPKVDHQEVPPRIFDTPHHQHTIPSIATPMATQSETDSWGTEKTIPHHFDAMGREEDPETTLGEGVTFRGELSFERLLRIDGTFEGDLLSQGKVIVGPKGVVKANLCLREAIVEGVIEGDISVQEKLELRGEAKILGNIEAKSICVDEGVTIVGQVTVKPDPVTSSAPSTEY